MSRRSERVSVRLLRRWGLPDPGDSKKSRGRVIAVGGSRRSPGAVLLSGEAALRVGAGRLGLLVSASVEAQMGIVMPESAVFPLPDEPDAPLADAVRGEVEGADAVLIGPGFDDADATRATVREISAHVRGCLVLDAYALGVLPDIPRSDLPARLVLTPNREEAEILLGQSLGRDVPAAIAEIAHDYDAVVSCYGDVVAPGGRRWRIEAGGAGLATSGSGDVLAGAVAGFCGRGLDPERAAVWATWAHASAGDRLTGRDGLGFLARELARELAPTLATV